MSIEEILKKISEWDCNHIVLTGGEPMIAPDLPELATALKKQKKHITIETAGTVLLDTTADLVSISPKLASSAPPAGTPGGWQARHSQARRRDDVILALMARGPYQLKFVIDAAADLAEALGWIDDLAAAAPEGVDRSRVFFMPQGRSGEELARTTAWLQQKCRAHGIRLAPRFHIEWFGHTRGT